MNASMLEAIADIKMVSETLSPADRLRHAGTRVRTDVIPDENHATIWPAAATRGLVHLYPTGATPGAWPAAPWNA